MLVEAPSAACPCPKIFNLHLSRTRFVVVVGEPPLHSVFIRPPTTIRRAASSDSQASRRASRGRRTRAGRTLFSTKYNAVTAPLEVHATVSTDMIAKLVFCADLSIDRLPNRGCVCTVLYCTRWMSRVGGCGFRGSGRAAPGLGLDAE